MNDEEIKEYAKQVIPETLEHPDIKLPSFVQKCENENGEIKFSLIISTKYGTALIWYSPLGAVEEIIKSTILQQEKTKDSQGELGKDGLPIELIKMFCNLTIRITTHTLLKNFAWEFAEVVSDQPRLAAKSLLFFISRNRKEKDSWKERTAAEMSKKADKVIEFFGEGRKQRLLAQNERIKKQGEKPKIFFAMLYADRLEMWKEAKSCYTKNEEYESRLAMVSAAFPMLDESLIARFDDLDPYASMPSAIALVDTARILEMPQANLSVRTLQDCLAESRNHLKSKSQTEIEKEFADFFGSYTGQEMTAKRIKQILENNAEEEGESLQ